MTVNGFSLASLALASSVDPDPENALDCRNAFATLVIVERLQRHEALFFDRLEDGTVRCHLCNHECHIAEGHLGICGVRRNDGGTLFSLNYGKIVAAHVDPIEKKPLFHFLPGSESFSIAAAGCNFRCTHCQNDSISQSPRLNKGRVDGQDTTPEAVVEAALRTGCQSVSYTYTEPTIFFEFALETAKIARGRGLANVFVSNGYTGARATETIAPFLDANNIDLKSFSDDHYKKICGARLAPVLETIKLMKSLGVWVEVTTLLIPGHNDSSSELSDIAGFIHSVDPAMPWHVSRFHPAFQMLDVPPTPLESLLMAREIGRKTGLKHIYVGNAQGDDLEQTICPGCRQILIDRRGYSIRKNLITDGRCPSCGERIAGVWVRRPGI